MQIRLLFPSTEDLKERCFLAFRTGIVFLTMEEIPQAGVFCRLDFAIQGMGLVIRAASLAAGPSAVGPTPEEDAGCWFRLLSISVLDPLMESWLQSIDSIVQQPPRTAAPLPQPLQATVKSPKAPENNSWQDDESNDELGWLSGNLSQD